MPTRTGSSSILALTGRQRGLSVVFCHLVHVIAAPYLSDSDRQLRLCATRAHAEGAVPSGMCPPWSRGESTAGSLRDDSKRAVLSFQEPSVSFPPLTSTYYCGLRIGASARHSTCVRSEDNLWESVLSFHAVGPGDSTQVTGFGGKHLYHLVKPRS